MVRSPLRGAALLLLAGTLAVMGCLAPAATGGGTAHAATATATFSVSQDTYTSQSNAAATHGSLTYLSANSGTGDERRTYVKVTVSALPSDASIGAASLQLRATTSSTGTVTVRSVGTAWDQSALTWANQPAPGAPVTSVTGVSAGNLALDVSSVVRGEGTYAFVLTSSALTTLTFASREAV
ncbi:MAG TPA: DNRLRE domain-containing protein, partial [Candidatus Nanopelagicales bacterium]|nr:DNRLRE domain-containing protein [Candidatus Nanopelagicales bacterium]